MPAQRVDFQFSLLAWLPYHEGHEDWNTFQLLPTFLSINNFKRRVCEQPPPVAWTAQFSCKENWEEQVSVQDDNFSPCCEVQTYFWMFVNMHAHFLMSVM